MKNITILIHHIKLNETGWWEKAVQNIIICSIGSEGNFPQSKNSILAKLNKELDQGIDKVRLEKQFEKLKTQKQIVNRDEDLWNLSDDVFRKFKEADEEQNNLENEAKNRFLKLSLLHCKDINPVELWDDFKSKLLFPLVKNIGAKTYEFISGKKSINLTEMESYQNFAKSYDGEKGEIENIVKEFMNFSDKATKSFLLKLLNVYFFLEATNLDESSVDEIYNFSKTQQNLNVFVDTNFLLTVLDLHDNPSNDATKALLDLLIEINDKVKIKFYILPNTIHEFQNLIYKFQDYILRLKPTIAYAKVVEESTEFSGIIKKYFQRCSEVKRIIPPEEYFEPYLTNFSVCYRNKGIELYNQNVDDYSQDKRVIDDLLDQTNYRLNRILEKNGVGKKLSEDEKMIIRNRIYDKFKHDCQIWHIVKDKRPQYFDSPKDVVNWIITLDFAFLEYDRYKQKTNNLLKVGICLHPNELISMLQFWVPRTEKFEKAILGNFRMPFLFNEIDSDSEKISIEILSSLSQFEGYQSYSKESIIEILTNRALRQKIKPSNTIEENAELIKTEVFKNFEESQKALALEKTTNKDLKSELVQVKSKLEQMNTKLELISKNYIVETENFLIQKQKEYLKSIVDERKQISNELDLIKVRIGDLEEMKKRGEAEISIKLNNFLGKFNKMIRKRGVYKKKLEMKILPKYFDNAKLSELYNEKNLLDQKLDSLISINDKENVIVFCENQNSVILNKLGFENVMFSPEKNSNSVFIKIRNNPDKFGLRDRDYLVDCEIEKLQKQYSNYFILGYYCFENYLYHPNNLIELSLKDFNLDDYLSEITRQKNSNKNKIISIYKKARDSYEEFKIDSEKIKSNNCEQIIEYLESDDLEIFFKAFSMKDYFNKKCIEKFNLTKDVLSSTNWFKGEFSKIIKMN